MYRWLVGLLGVGRWLLTCKILPFIYFLGGGIGVFKLSVQIALIIDLFLALSTCYLSHIPWKGKSFCVL